jgi:hypothetical protein
MFQDFFAIDKNRIYTEVITLPGVNDIVKTRGDIAHNVYTENYLKKETLIQYYDTINKTVKDIDLLFYNFLPHYMNGKKLWQNTYI